MAKPFDQVLREQLGAQLFEIMRLTAQNLALTEENASLKDEIAKMKQVVRETSS